jgi:hypothetical protein
MNILFQNFKSSGKNITIKRTVTSQHVNKYVIFPASSVLSTLDTSIPFPRAYLFFFLNPVGIFTLYFIDRTVRSRAGLSVIV